MIICIVWLKKAFLTQNAFSLLEKMHVPCTIYTENRICCQKKKRAHYRKTHVLNVKSIFGLKLHFGAEKRMFENEMLAI